MAEYELIFSHTLHHVAGVDDATIMVQRGYSLALEDQEVLPLWEESPINSSIMVDEFGIWHVKEWSYEMTRALLQRPTTLSLGSLGLLMEYSQDQFTYDALDGQVRDESYGVVDGDIYYHDMIFLA